MKKRLTIFSLFSFLICTTISAQAFLKSEYIGTSSYRDKDNKKMKDYKGSSAVYSGGLNVPLSLKIDENNRPTMWSIGMGASYASLDNKNFLAEDAPLSDVLNMQLAVNHLRPLTPKMSLMLSIGMGVYLGDTRFSQIRGRHLLGVGAGVAIWHLKPNLDLGAGLALNNTFGYPMVFPALYLNWSLEGKFKVRASMVNAIELSAGYSFNKYVDLNIIVTMNAQMAMIEGSDKDVVFTHQYIVVGLQPKINITKNISIPITGGLNAVRSAYFKKRSMKAFFSNKDDEHDPFFQAAPYFSAGITYKM